MSIKLSVYKFCLDIDYNKNLDELKINCDSIFDASDYVSVPIFFRVEKVPFDLEIEIIDAILVNGPDSTKIRLPYSGNIVFKEGCSYSAQLFIGKTRFYRSVDIEGPPLFFEVVKKKMMDKLFIRFRLNGNVILKNISFNDEFIIFSKMAQFSPYVKVSHCK